MTHTIAEMIHLYGGALLILFGIVAVLVLCSVLLKAYRILGLWHSTMQMVHQSMIVPVVSTVVGLRETILQVDRSKKKSKK